MHGLALGIAVLLAAAIIVIGALYLSRPGTVARSFGLPPPDSGPATASWLRLKGVRDVATGLIVLAVLRWDSAHAVGIVLLAAAAIPLGDMLVVLAGRGSARAALGMHGATALVIVLAALPLALGAG